MEEEFCGGGDFVDKNKDAFNAVVVVEEKTKKRRSKYQSQTQSPTQTQLKTHGKNTNMMTIRWGLLVKMACMTFLISFLISMGIMSKAVGHLQRKMELEPMVIKQEHMQQGYRNHDEGENGRILQEITPSSPAPPTRATARPQRVSRNGTTRNSTNSTNTPTKLVPKPKPKPKPKPTPTPTPISTLEPPDSSSTPTPTPTPSSNPSLKPPPVIPTPEPGPKPSPTTAPPSSDATPVPSSVPTPTPSESPVTPTPSPVVPPITPAPVTDVPVVPTPSPTPETPPTDSPPVSPSPPTETPAPAPTPTPTPTSDVGGPSPEPPTNSRPPVIPSDAPSIPPTTEPPLEAPSPEPPTSREPRPNPPSPAPNDDTNEDEQDVPVAIEDNKPKEDQVTDNTPDTENETPEETPKQDIIYSEDSPMPTPPKDPLAVPEIPRKSEQPNVLDLDPNPNGDDDNAKKYVRGKITSDNQGNNIDKETGDQAQVIGGRKRGYLSSEQESALSKSAEKVQDALKYASSAFAGVSVALLLFFHYVSLDRTLSWSASLWSPNTWEFLMYVAFLQQMANVSQLSLTKAPYFLLEFTDSFAWTNFLLQRHPTYASTTTTTRSALSSTSEASFMTTMTRRLETIILEGIVSYADRIGVSEAKILFHCVVGFVVLIGIFLLCFFVMAILAKRKAEQQAFDDAVVTASTINDDSTIPSANLMNSSHKVQRLRSASIRTLGLCVLIWYFALFPLSLFSSFEISMEIKAKEAADALSVAIISLVVICFGVLALLGRIILHKSLEELKQFENLATWGSLYAEYLYHRRMFFVVVALVQILSGILMGSIDHDPSQLISLIVLQVVFLFTVFLFSPFSDNLVLYFTYGLGMMKILNFGLCFAFLNSNKMSGKSRGVIAQTYIVLNSVLIMLWFIRLLIVFSTYIRVWMAATSASSSRGDDTTNGTGQSSNGERKRMMNPFGFETDVYAGYNTSKANVPYNDANATSTGGLTQMGSSSSFCLETPVYSLDRRRTAATPSGHVPSDEMMSRNNAKYRNTAV